MYLGNSWGLSVLCSPRLRDVQRTHTHTCTRMHAHTHVRAHTREWHWFARILATSQRLQAKSWFSFFLSFFVIPSSLPCSSQTLRCGSMAMTHAYSLSSPCFWGKGIENSEKVGVDYRGKKNEILKWLLNVTFPLSVNPKKRMKMTIFSLI